MESDAGKDFCVVSASSEHMRDAILDAFAYAYLDRTISLLTDIKLTTELDSLILYFNSIVVLLVDRMTETLVQSESFSPKAAVLCAVLL